MGERGADAGPHHLLVRPERGIDRVHAGTTGNHTWDHDADGGRRRPSVEPHRCWQRRPRLPEQIAGQFGRQRMNDARACLNIDLLTAMSA
jgi:hypothetical protein